MQNNQEIQKNCIEEDEIDLRELFLTLWDSKVLISIITILITLTALIYVSLKNPTPVYKGTVLIEIGEGVNSAEPSEFDNSFNLKSIVEAKFPVKALVPKRTNQILQIEATNKNKQQISHTLENTVSYILKKHQEKTKLFTSYIMTKQVGEITISDTPINTPKKKLIVIVAFITGFILSIFLVFFLAFVKGLKEETTI